MAIIEKLKSQVFNLYKIPQLKIYQKLARKQIQENK